MDYLNAIQIYEQSYSINNNQEEVVEKLASSLVDARLTKKADSFLSDALKIFPNSTHLNSLMGYNLLSLNRHKEGLGFLKKGTGFIEFNNDSVKII